MPFKCSRTMGSASMTYTRHQRLRSQTRRLHFNSGSARAAPQGHPGRAVPAQGWARGQRCSAQPLGAPSALDLLQPSCQNSGRGKWESSSGYSRAGKPSSSQGLQQGLPGNEAHKNLCLQNFHILKLTRARSGYEV